MRFCAFLAIAALAARLSSSCEAQSPFTLQQVLSAPYASNLVAAPKGALFAWVEDAEGRHNLYVGGAGQPARALTHNSEDDGQDITDVAWAPDGSAIAYSYGAESGADGKPANPAHLQRATPVQVLVQPLAADAKAIVMGEGRSPMFTRDGKSLLFVQAGQVWIEDFSEASPAHQLVFDRGSASSMTLSPDGRTLAFISSRREVNQPSHRFLALFDMASHTLTFPAPSTANDSAPAFSPDGKRLVWLRSPFTQTPEFAADRVSANPWSVQLLDLASHVSRTMYAPEANNLGSVLPHMATGAPRLFYTAANRIVFASEADGWVHLYAMDPGSSVAASLLTAGKFEVEDPAISSDAKLLAWSSSQQTVDLQDVDRRHIWQLNLASPGESPKYLTSGDGIETRPAFAADGSTWAALVAGSLPMHPVLIGPTAAQKPLDRVDATVALVTPTEILFHSLDNLVLHGQLFLPKGMDCSSVQSEGAGAVAKKKQVPCGNDRKERQEQTQTQKQVPCGNDRKERQEQKQVPCGNDKKERQEQTQEQKQVPFGNDRKERQEQKQTLAKRPAIVFLHGGPRRQMLLGYPSGEYYSNAYAMNQYLTSLGFIVLSVNYRCGIGYGLEFRQCLHGGADGAAEYADVLAAQKYLASRADVDASRIGVWGGSYGGYLTALALARNSDLFAAGVDFHGVHDWNLEDNAGDWLVGTAEEKAAIAAKALASSPLADVSHWTSPVLLIHGDNDPEVAYAETPVLADKLRAQHAPVEELIFPDEVHGFLLHKDWLAAYVAAAAFFVRTLKP